MDSLGGYGAAQTGADPRVPFFSNHELVCFTVRYYYSVRKGSHSYDT